MGAKLPGVRRAGAPMAPVAEINVTPLVDVMLVLLIVFMIAAPLMANGVKVDLPTSNAKPLTESKPPVAVSIDAQGKVFVDQAEVSGAALIAALRAATEGDLQRSVHVRGDRSVAYGQVIETMGLLAEAGFTKVALVSEPPRRD